jgi:hypothetical protein
MAGINRNEKRLFFNGCDSTFSEQSYLASVFGAGVISTALQ